MQPPHDEGLLNRVQAFLCPVPGCSRGALKNSTGLAQHIQRAHPDYRGEVSLLDRATFSAFGEAVPFGAQYVSLYSFLCLCMFLTDGPSMLSLLNSPIRKVLSQSHSATVRQASWTAPTLHWTTATTAVWRMTMKISRKFCPLTLWTMLTTCS